MKWKADKTRKGIPCVKTDDGRTVCSFDWHDLAQSQRDATLIAAAPDFLQALRVIASFATEQDKEKLAILGKNLPHFAAKFINESGV